MRRETLIVYGDCQAQALVRVLHCIRMVVERFDLKYHPVEQQHSNWLIWRDDIIESSFVLLQSLASLDEYPLNFVSRELRPPSLLFPTMTFPSLWPYSTEFGGCDAVAEQLSDDRGKTGLHYFDALLGLLRKIPDKDIRFQAYRNLRSEGVHAAEKLLKARNIYRIFELDCIRLLNIDKHFGLSVGQLIIFSFRDRRLFHTVKHPAVELFYVLVSQLLQRLRLTSDLSRPLTDSLSYYQIPIHPAVAKTLNVSWATSDATYNALGKQWTFENYTRRYMDEFG